MVFHNHQSEGFMKKILVINGPNLNMLGTREPEVYGTLTLDAINTRIASEAEVARIEVEFFQSNSEGEIIDAIHSAEGNANGIILNAGAYTHYSYAIRDAIASVSVPCIEVHLSNVHARDEFRRTSVIAPVCMGQISGFGIMSYLLAMRALIQKT
jgi:3-dehydroquinate dehydratase-2